MNKPIAWKDRAEKAEAHNIECTRRWSVQVSELRAELERTKKQAAEMRDALQHCWEHINSLLDQGTLCPLILDRARAWKNVTESYKALEGGSQ